ncbi:MAG: hypothetical protein ABJA02_11455 [Acidobacteriota bacterium]
MFDAVRLLSKPASQIAFAVALIGAFSYMAAAQTMVDRTIATVSDGVRIELITYSDVLWQLSLQPNASLDPPRPDDLNAAVLRLIDQRLFALEAERLPRPAPDDAAIAAEIAETLKAFPSTAVFEERLKKVGFDSIKDDNFERIIARRVAIKNYLDFRFRSFTVVTPEDEAKYYRDDYLPDFRTRFPGVVVPTLDEKRKEIRSILTEQRVGQRIETFLDDAKRRVEIEILVNF